ncbi:MAG: dihydroorotate dehydrogenase, partial [bacterium]|nr:dihydroorotate dehydrogenase [bacterium]
GGIASLDDVLEFFSVGADAVQIGTENFTNPTVTENIINELDGLCEKMNLNVEELKRKLR